MKRFCSIFVSVRKNQFDDIQSFYQQFHGLSQRIFLYSSTKKVHLLDQEKVTECNHIILTYFFLSYLLTCKGRPESITGYKFGYFRLKLNYRKRVFFFLVHLFARDILLMKKVEIQKTKPTFIILVLKVEYQVHCLIFIGILQACYR